MLCVDLRIMHFRRIDRRIVNHKTLPLSGLHQLASQFGEGLRPELAALLCRDEELQREGVVPLGAAPRSSGPAVQNASDAALEAAGVERLQPQHGGTAGDGNHRRARG